MTALASAADLADAIRLQAVTAGAAEPTVRGSDWQTATVTAVGSGTVDCGVITARCLDSYQNRAVGDRVVIAQSGNGNWICLGRTAGAGEQAFLTYTPTWTSTGTNPSIGNGNLSGRYWRNGSLVQGSISMTIGSSTTLGTSNYFWQLPTNVAGLITVSSVQVLTAGSPSHRWAGQGIISSSDTNKIGVYMPTAAANGELVRCSATAASPSGTFASGDQLRVAFQYESA
ncbi:hypothetical protein [Streptomyces sp. NPDC097640]|uniref:hypothetical protein n=1 Tax=Streptomyces sp. NPDC097640 TaxID=3157229 RepID=UPI0033243029